MSNKEEVPEQKQQNLPETSTSASGAYDAEVEEMASDYAAYLKVDMDSELKGVYESVEEMQLRLEEFNSILGMMQANSSKSISENVPRFHELKPHVDNFCKRVNALEAFVERVNADLDNLEAHLEVAEANIGSSDNKLAKLNPLTYFKKSSEQATSSTTQAVPEPPNIFKTDDYFEATDTKE